MTQADGYVHWSADIHASLQPTYMLPGSCFALGCASTLFLCRHRSLLIKVSTVQHANLLAVWPADGQTPEALSILIVSTIGILTSLCVHAT